MVERGERRSLLSSLPLRSPTFLFGLLAAVGGAAALVYGKTNGTDTEAFEEYGPWGIRLGLSLAAGYVVGHVFREARGKALALLGTLVAALIAAKYFGLLDDPAVQEKVSALKEGTLAGASKLKEWVVELLPDGAAASVGGVLGLRGGRRPEE